MDNLNNIRKDEFLPDDAEKFTADTPVSQKQPAVEPDEVDRILMSDWFSLTGKEESKEETEEETEEDDGPELILDAISRDMPEEAAEETEEETEAEPEEFFAEEPTDEETEYEETEDAEEVEEEDITPLPKSRPKRKSGYGLFGLPHIVSTAIWLLLILAIGISLGRIIWVCCADVMAFGKESRTVTITITEEDDIDSISKKLGQANLVRYPGLFKFFATITGKDEDIGTGTFTLNARLDYNAMINAMFNPHDGREVVTIMFPEGFTCAQVFKRLADNGVCTLEELETYAAQGELKEYWFLEGVARDSKYCLEGYLAPDTYEFYKGDSPRRVLEKLLDEFDDRFTDIMKEDFETMKKSYAERLKAKGFSDQYIQENTLTIHQVVSLASIIQKETSSDDESFKIAAVFYNRLVNPDILTLGADATVHYALGDYFLEIPELTKEHLEFDSPYNTRVSKGIPPGPICNMGSQALYAALEPYVAKGDAPSFENMHYFVFDPEKGEHRFAETLEEHEKNLEDLGY